MRTPANPNFNFKFAQTCGLLRRKEFNMATHTFYLSWQVEYDYSRPEMLTGEREKLLSLLRSNGFNVSFADCWNSEKYLPENTPKKRKSRRFYLIDRENGNQKKRITMQAIVDHFIGDGDGVVRWNKNNVDLDRFRFEMDEIGYDFVIE